ncbi:MAG: DUF6671 family protein [Curvibacter sp.]|jgi:hypothetical protein|nr:hypothetical protein [Curvibacter sp.]
MTHHYAGQRAVLLTQHGKEDLVAPVLRDAVGCRVERFGGFDTDTLGTFARDVPRAGTQLEAARRKARIGMSMSGCALGLGSEGSFGPDPYTGLMPWNVEMLVWIDEALGLEVVGLAQGPARSAHRTVRDGAALRQFAHEAGFPAHQLMLRPNDENDPRIRKGLADEAQLQAAFAWAQALASSGTVFVEHDLRAHCNPTRQQLIRQAAVDLGRKLKSLCPACEAPGFWISAVQGGRLCRDCGAPTRQALKETWSCARCQHQSEQASAGPATADPAHCNLCNP